MGGYENVRGNFLVGFATDDFVAICLQVMSYDLASSQTRLLEFNEGEEVFVRVKTTRIIRLEFDRAVVSIFQEPGDGSLFIKTTEKEADSDTESEKEEDSDSETQFLETQIEVYDTPEIVRRYAGGGFESVNRKHLSRIELENIQDLQNDLFGETQLDE